MCYYNLAWVLVGSGHNVTWHRGALGYRRSGFDQTGAVSAWGSIRPYGADTASGADAALCVASAGTVG